MHSPIGIQTQKNKEVTYSLPLQAQWALWQKDREHGECCPEVQHVRTQLEKTQGSMHSQELELERLRLLEMWLGQHHREQQVSAEPSTTKSIHSLANV